MSANSSKVQEAEQLRAQGEARLKRLRHTSKPRVLQELKAMDPTLFEYSVGALFERRGYQATIVGATGDEGVDVFLHWFYDPDPLAGGILHLRCIWW